MLFNPIDRALYLRVHNREPRLMVWSNWSHPFQGFANAAVYRTIAGATYLFFQDTFRFGFQLAVPALAQPSRLLHLQLCVGVFAGAANGVCLNWFQLLKFRLWSQGSGRFFAVARQVYVEAGARMFFRGTGISVVRDLSFGVVYELLRAPGLAPGTNGYVQFACNVGAGALASMVSSPFNYCRNVVYGAPLTASPMRTARLLAFLVRECKAQPSPLRHMNSRLNLGWGTLRVGLGIAVGQYVYSRVERRASP